MSTKIQILASLLLSVTIIAVCFVVFRPERRWWDSDRVHLVEFVRHRIAESRRVDIVRVRIDGLVRGVVDRSVVTKMAESFDLSSETSPDTPLFAEYFSLKIVGDEGEISFDVSEDYVMFGDGGWACSARISPEFVDILKSTVVADRTADWSKYSFPVKNSEIGRKPTDAGDQRTGSE